LSNVYCVLLHFYYFICSIYILSRQNPTVRQGDNAILHSISVTGIGHVSLIPDITSYSNAVWMWPPEWCFVSKFCILLSKCSNTVSSWCKFSIFLTSSLRGSNSVRFSQLLLQIILLLSSKYILCQKVQQALG
jgi:hypothetical protein